MKLLLSAVLVCSTVIACAQPLPVSSYENRTWEWIGETWDGNNSPYVKLASEIRKQISKGQNLNLLLEKSISEAQRKPKDAQAQFARGYFLLGVGPDKLVDFSKRRANLASELREAWLGMSRIRSPRCREFSRLRFLIEAREAPSVKLLPMGERLYKSDSSDFGVKYYLVKLLNYTGDLAQIKRATVLAKEIAQSKPKASSSYSLLGSCYSWMWWTSKKKEYVPIAIENYQKSINLSNDPEWKKWAAHLIESLKDDLKKAGIN